jgi:hypothetical protein
MTRTDGNAPALPWPDTNEQFLRAIAGDADWGRMHVTGFRGDPKRGGAWGGGPAATRRLRPGDNNYFTVSLFIGGKVRQGPVLERWVVLGVDDVGPKIDPAKVVDLLGVPTYRMETSPGNEQWGYRLATLVRDAGWVKAFTKALVGFLVGQDGKDPGMRDATRYLRLPVGRNHKPAFAAIGGFVVGLTHWAPNLVLDLTPEICARLGVSPVSPDGVPCEVDGAKPVEGFAHPAPARSLAGDAAIDELAEQDILFKAMRKLDLVLGGPRATAMGRGYDILCPWVDEHTDRATTGTAYVPVLQRFECHHGHCRDRTAEHVEQRLEEMLREESGGLSGLIDVAFDPVDPADVPLPPAHVETDDERAFFARFVYLRPRDAFWDVDKQVMLKDRAINTEWLRRLADVLPMTGTGRQRRLVPPGTWYLHDRRGRHVDGVIWWPGEAQIVLHNRQRLCNLWRPVPRPLAGSPVDDDAVRPWLDLFWHVIGGATLEEWQLGRIVLDWLAMVLGSGIKGGWQVVVTGQQGIGKDLILLPVMKALGEQQAQVLRGDAMASGFSEWMALRLVQMNETRQTTRGSFTPHDQMARLKHAFDLGKEWLPINPKYGVPYQARNTVMAWITSNEAVPLRLEEGDRRFLVLDRAHVTRWPSGDYARLVRWFEQQEGLALVAEWLMCRWETMPDARKAVLSGIAPMTEAKQVMIEESQDPVDVWLTETIAAVYPAVEAMPDVVTVDFVRDRMLQAQREGRFSVSPTQLHPVSIGRRLARVGGTQLFDGSPVLVQGRQTRVWALRFVKEYKLLGRDEIAKVANLLGPSIGHNTKH